MPILENWDPLNLPRGSVRALVTLILLGVLWALMIQDREIRFELAFLVLMILGHYFGSRSKASQARRGPLGLPRGSIRGIIIVGFGVVGWQLWKQGRLFRDGTLNLADPAVTILLLVSALPVGILVGRVADLASGGEATSSRRLFENIKSVVVLIATALLVFSSVFGQDEAFSHNVTLIAAPIVGLYFGSRRA